MSEERTSDAELECTVADGVGCATPAQTTDVGVTLLATVDSEAPLANGAGNIDDGGTKGNPGGPETNGGMPTPVGGRKGDSGGPKYGIMGGANGIRPPAYAGCIGGINGGMNGEGYGIGGTADTDVTAGLLVIIRGSKGGKRNGLGKAANWAADDADVTAAAVAAVAVAVAVVADELASDDDDDDSLVGGFSFSPCNNPCKITT